MRRKKENLLIMSCSIFYMIAIAGSRPLITLYASELGADHIEIGVIVAIYALLPLMLSIYIGKLVDQFGKRTPLLLSVVLGFIALIIPVLLNNLIGVYISQMIAGLGQIIFVIAFQSYVGRFSKKKLTDYYVSIFSIGMAVGHFIGPLISGLIADTVSYAQSLAWLGIAIIFMLPFIFFLDQREEKRRGAQDKVDDKRGKSTEFLRNDALRQAFFISAIVLLGKDLFIAYFPLLAADKGYSNSMIGFIIALNAAAGILIRMVLPVLLKRFKEYAIVVLSILISGLLFVSLPVFDHLWLVIILSFILGFGLGIGQPLSISLTINLLPHERVGEGLGLRLTINKMTQVAGPIVFGAFSSLTGIASIFYICGAVMIAGAVNVAKKQ